MHSFIQEFDDKNENNFQWAIQIGRLYFQYKQRAISFVNFKYFVYFAAHNIIDVFYGWNKDHNNEAVFLMKKKMFEKEYKK